MTDDPTAPGDGSVLARAAELEASGLPVALVTVVRATGSTPRAPGARMIVYADGRIEGTIGGGKVELEAIAAAQEAIATEEPRFVEVQLTQQLGMCCGGQVAMFIEPLVRPPTLLIFGAGHVGAALCRSAAAAGFRVHVADERGELLTRERLPAATALHDDLEDPALPYGERAFVMVTTHDHALDQRIVERSLARPSAWLGLIGSRRKAELTRQRLERKDFTAEQIAHLRCPVGLAIGAETPEEIAVSILGELIAVRRGVASLGKVATSLEEKRPRLRQIGEDG